MHPDDRVKIEAAAGYIQQHLTENITLAKLMAECGLQATTLKKLFKEHYGLTPADFKLTIRMEYAKELLEQLFQVKEVARMVGYSNSSNFSKAFRRYAGISPSDYSHT